ncbi:MAG: hypothetical protein WBA46_04845, partial [Thermomicrobiales bacterium]
MRTMRWILGLVLVLGVAVSPLMTAFAQDASPVVVDQPVSTEPDTPDPVATGQDPANTAAPTDVATDAPAGGPTATDPVFVAAVAPVMTIDGGTDSPVSVPAGGQATVAVSGLGQVQIFFYTAPGGCPQGDPSRVMYNGPVIGDTSFTRTGTPGMTEYLQAQLYGGEWSNCIQVTWLAEPTATATAPMPSGPGAMSLTVNGQTSGTLSVNPDDLVTVHAVNVSTLMLYSDADCGGVPYSASGVMLDSVLSQPANAWITPPTASFSMQAHGMDSSTGACITVSIIQPTDTAVPTATATSTAVPTDPPAETSTAADTPTATSVPTNTETATSAATATATATQLVPVLTVNGSTLSPVHVPGGSVATLLASGLTPGGTVAYGASPAGCPSSVASPGMQGPFAVGGDGTSTFQAGGISGATWYYQASQNGVWSNCLQLIWGATFTTPTPTQTSPALFVNDDDAAVVHVNYPSASIWVRWSGIPRLNVYPSADCSGIPVTSYTVSGFGSVY